MQNGVENERAALRYFGRVHGVAVMCPTAFLEPRHVVAYAAPTTGILDVGRYPDGVDDLTERLAAAFRSASFTSEAAREHHAVEVPQDSRSLVPRNTRWTGCAGQKLS